MIKIEITQDDIDNGTRFDGCGCPVARAVARAVDVPLDIDRLAIGPRDVYIHKPNTPTSFNFHQKLPLKAQDFIRNFDMEKPVKPFSFMLRGYNA